MERFSFIDEESADLSEIPLSTLTAEIAAAQEHHTFLQNVVETDGLAPLLHLIVGQALPFL